METFRKIYPQEFYRRFLVHELRPDGRTLSNHRKTKITAGSIQTANGSSFVKLGQTSIVAGIKAEMGPPTQEFKNGRVVVNVELTPICSTKFRPGRPSEQAQVLGDFLNNILKSTNCVSFNNLFVEQEGEKKYVWYLYADLYCLNYDGNVTDACLIALITALKNVRLPKVTLSDDGSKLYSFPEDLHQLTITNFPISFTFAMLEEYILVDPTSEEEELSTTTFSVIATENGQLCSILKPGGNPIPEATLKDCIEKTKIWTKEVVTLMDKALESDSK